MRFSRLLCSTAALALAVPSLSAAQEAEDQPADRPADRSVAQADDDDIFVIAERLRGQVDTDQAPVLTLDPEDIAAYGANSIADLVAALEPQTGSSRGRGGGQPVYLINGVRIGSFREFRSYPSEAIQRVEVLPEETAQKFGFPPDRRVVNFILKDNYSAITVEAEYEQPGIGGYSRTEQEATLLKITKAGRINLNVERSDVSLLTESERDIIQTGGSVPTVAGDPDPAEFRSLISENEQWEASANYAAAFLNSGSSLSLNATFNTSDFTTLAGLNTVILADSPNPDANTEVRTFGEENPLERRFQTDTYSSSLSYNRPVGGYQLTATVNGSITDSLTETDRRADVTALVADAAAGNFPIDGIIPVQPDAGFDTARSKTYFADSKVTLNGSPLYLPAGEVSTTLDLGYTWQRIDSEDSLSATPVQLTRGDLSGGFSFTVPITSTRDEVWDALGTISLNGQLGFNNYSDFGTLYRVTGGVNWKPFEVLDLQATYVWREVPPSLSQLGAPQVTAFNIPTFDLATGNTSLVTVTSGGNPNLLAETQSDWSFAANWEFKENASFRVDYSRNKSDNVSSSFPFLTPEIEAAFPDRVTRDAAGVLTAIDQRPVDYFETRTERVTFGLNLNGSFGKATPQAEGEGGGRPDGARGGGGGRPQAGGPPAGVAGGSGPAGAEGGGRPRGPDFANMSEDQRSSFMSFRTRLCADDGEAFLVRIAEAIGRGETVDELGGLDPEQAKQMLERFRNEDGSIDTERLGQFRARMCGAGGPGAGPEGGGAQASGGGGRPAGVGRGGRAGGGGDGRGRYFFNLSHSVELNREILIGANGPQLDLLNGDSLSSLGTPRNTSSIEAGAFRGGLGLRLSARYTGEARIDGTEALGSTDLFIDDLAKFDLRMFVDLGEVLKKQDGPLKNMRVSFRADNIFDGRRIVRDSNGDTPIGFQPLLLDPTGRYLGIDIRKLF